MGLRGEAAIVGYVELPPERLNKASPAPFVLEQWAELAATALEDAGLSGDVVNGIAALHLAESEIFVPSTVAEYLGEHLGSVGRGHHDPLDAGLGRLGYLVSEERNPCGRKQRLRRPDRQRPQPGALPADEQDRLKLACALVAGRAVVVVCNGGHVQADYPCSAEAARS